MGRIAPGKHRNPGWSLPAIGKLHRSRPRRPQPGDNSHAIGHPMLTPLKRLWYLPEKFNWMSPLPLFHRRGILISAVIVMLALLWPYSPTDRNAPSQDTDSHAGQGDVMQADLVDNTHSPAPPPASAGGQLQRYRIVEGQTLAQLFRQHNLPVGDVFAMAQAEGDDKPLSSLHAGQQVAIQLNAQGVVSSLEIDVSPTATVKFTRQPDGTYIRN